MQPKHITQKNAYIVPFWQNQQSDNPLKAIQDEVTENKGV